MLNIFFYIYKIVFLSLIHYRYSNRKTRRVYLAVAVHGTHKLKFFFLALLSTFLWVRIDYCQVDELMKIVHIQKTISLTRFLPRRVQQKKRNVDLNSHDWVSCHRSLCCFLTPFCTILSLDYFSLSLSLFSKHFLLSQNTIICLVLLFPLQTALRKTDKEEYLIAMFFTSHLSLPPKFDDT